jgi:hypothetical protein
VSENLCCYRANVAGPISLVAHCWYFPGHVVVSRTLAWRGQGIVTVRLGGRALASRFVTAFTVPIEVRVA